MPEPIRMCAGCRRREPVSQLVRLVWDDHSGTVVLDQRRRQPGRGVNLHPACLAQALRSRAIGRGLRRTLAPEQTASAVAALETLSVG